MTVSFNRPEYNADLALKMEEVRESYLSDSTSDDVAFCYLIADMFEGRDAIEEERVKYTDGPNDEGVDLVVKDNDSITIYQCKSFDLEKNPEGKVFDDTPVNELSAAIAYFLSDDDSTASEKVRQLRNGFRLDQETASLSAVLAVQGRLSKQAKERFDQVKEEYFNGSNVSVRLIDEEVLYDQWHELRNIVDPKRISIKLKIPSETSIMKMGQWFCAVLKIEPLLEAMKKYQTALFDANVRSSLRRTSVNKSIMDTLKTAKGQKKFVHLNNGLVITCNHFSFAHDKTTITLNGAQVVNGCQTLSTIWDYYEEATDEKRAELRDNLTILAKVVTNSEDMQGLLDEIIVASNNQNPMNERNLCSNSSAQKRIQQSFYREPLPNSYRFFYIRKDGELESFLKHDSREVKKRFFEIEGSTRRGPNRYRHIDNEDLAKAWWAWLGNGSQVNGGGVNYFSESMRQKIFEQRPTNEFWEAARHAHYRFDSSLLAEGSPSQYEYLLAMAVWSYLAARVKPVLGPKAFRNSRIEELKEKGDLSPNATKQEIDSKLRDDSVFLEASWLRQMSPVLTEVAAFLLCRCYGPLNAETSKKLLGFDDLAFWVKNGMDPKLIGDPNMSEGTFVLERVYDLLKISAASFFTLNKDAILLENRPKLFLGRPDNVMAIKEKCVEFNESYRDYPSGHKPPRMTYFESFPATQ